VTFSICVREPYEDDDGERRYRFGVAVTTRLPGVGAVCPHANEHGAVATQSDANVRLGRKGVEYLADGLAVEDALGALVDADEGRERRQLHGVGRDGSYTFSGEACNGWFGETSGENYTVAGNLLTGPDVVERTAEAYEAVAFGGDPLTVRLVDALAAGHEAGGDRRTDLAVQSAAVRVADSGDGGSRFTDDVRVDATETPVADLRATVRRAREGYEAALARSEGDEDDEDDDGDDATDG
jgi:uncharacterized Ntn-hydrolase superfamily protein